MLEWPMWMKAIAFSLATMLLPIRIVPPEAASWGGGAVASVGADASLAPSAPPAPVPVPPVPAPVVAVPVPPAPVTPVPLPPAPLTTDEPLVAAVGPAPPLPALVVVGQPK